MKKTLLVLLLFVQGALASIQVQESSAQRYSFTWDMEGLAVDDTSGGAAAISFRNQNVELGDSAEALIPAFSFYIGIPPKGSVRASFNPRQTRSKHTVEAVLESAARVFSAVGYGRATTNAIAEQAGVSVGSLYQYFPNKLALLAAVHERHLETLMRAMTKACRAASPAGLEAALRAVIEVAASEHRTRAPLVRAFARHLPEGESMPPAGVGEFQSALRQLLVRHRSELRLADYDLALFMLRNFGRSLMQGAVEGRPGDLSNGAISRELLATAVFFLTGRRSRRGGSGRIARKSESTGSRAGTPGRVSPVTRRGK